MKSKSLSTAATSYLGQVEANKFSTETVPRSVFILINFTVSVVSVVCLCDCQCVSLSAQKLKNYRSQIYVTRWKCLILVTNDLGF